MVPPPVGWDQFQRIENFHILQLDRYTFTFLVGILPSSTLRTFRGGTSQKNHPVHKKFWIMCRFSFEQKGKASTRKQSPVLKKVDLRVSMKNYNHFKMFGTELRIDRSGVFQDPCAGDSGGPLMYLDRRSYRWTLIGQIIVI